MGSSYAAIHTNHSWLCQGYNHLRMIERVLANVDKQDWYDGWLSTREIAERVFEAVAGRRAPMDTERYRRYAIPREQFRRFAGGQ